MFSRRQHHALNAMHFGRAAVTAAPREIRLDVVKVPLVDEQSAFFQRGGLFGGGFFGQFALGAGLLIAHRQPRSGRSRFIGSVHNCQHRRQFAPHFFPAVGDVPLDGDGPVVDIQQFIDISYLRQAEFFRQLRPHLGRVSVNRLPSAQHNIHRAEVFDAATENIARRQCVAGRRPPVSNQHRPIRPAAQSRPQHLAGAGQAHGHNGYRPAAAFLDGQRQLQGVEVLRIEYRRQRRPVHRPIIIHGLARHRLGVRHLFG